MGKSYRSRADTICCFIESAIRRYELDEGLFSNILSATRESESRWLDWEVWNTAIDLVNTNAPATVYDWVDFGLDLSLLQSNALYHLLLKSISVSAYLKALPALTATMTNHSRIGVQLLEENTALIQVTTEPEYLHANAGQSIFYQTGALLAFFKERHIPVQVHSLCYQSRLMENILARFYKRYNFNIEQRGQEIFADGELLAHTGIPIGDTPGTMEETATVVSKDLVRNGLTLLRRNEVFDTPSSRIMICWQPENSLSRLWRQLCNMPRSIQAIELLYQEIPPYIEAALEPDRYPALPRDSASTDSQVFAGLSKREQQVTNLLLAGKSRREIATSLFIALPTVKRHIEAIYAKLGVHSRFEILRIVKRPPLQY